MNGRERVLAALRHEEADRVPRDLGGTESSGLTAGAHVRLCRGLGVEHVPKVFEPFQYVSYVDAALRGRFGIDTLNLTPEPAQWTLRRHPRGFDVYLPARWREEPAPDGSTVIRRGDGSVAARRPAGGWYFDPANPPLAGVRSPGELAKCNGPLSAFDWPFFADEEPAAMRGRARALHEQGGCVVLNLCCHLLAAGQLLRGFETFMVDLLTDGEMVHALLERLVAAYVERAERLAHGLEPFVDVVLLNDDLGTQQGPMLSPDLYRKMVKPYQKLLFARVKKAFAAPLLFHSCGSVRAFLPDLIEVGVDALNPVQVSAAGMAPRELKRAYGRELTFWGGGVDTQRTLNRGTVADVRDAVRRHVEAFAPGGGFVFCQVHNVQPDVPPENVAAMFEALDEYR
ncbi:MAG: hypothetical protein JXR37_11265 [Kiritimatiellae bacterium]|nr:hypothetical protein [Kiritimatiellia bacterium]